MNFFRKAGAGDAAAVAAEKKRENEEFWREYANRVASDLFELLFQAQVLAIGVDTMASRSVDGSNLDAVRAMYAREAARCWDFARIASEEKRLALEAGKPAEWKRVKP